MPSPLIIPIFITHQGCPHRCVFCNQQPITGIMESSSVDYSSEAVTTEIHTWLQRSPRNGRRVQVAFFGGSFTGLPRNRQQELLETVQPYIKKGLVDEIRLSTRPDYINQDIVEFLKQYSVKVVELGIQSMDQQVLTASNRGHTVKESKQAISLLKGENLTVGAQLMVGLPAETTTSAIQGARLLSSLQPDFARIYPALVIKNSALALLFAKGLYSPLSLNQAVSLSARITSILHSSNIPVIRIGLQHSDELDSNLIAGPHHPALGELVKSRRLFKQARRLLSKSQGRKFLIVAERDRSIFYGQKKCSLKRLEQLGLMEKVDIVFNNEQPRGEVTLTDKL